jgi:hypothetical protein
MAAYSRGYSMPETLEAERNRLLEALRVIADFGNVNLAGAWEHELKDIVRAVVDRARDEVRKSEEAAAMVPERFGASGDLKQPWKALVE